MFKFKKLPMILSTSGVVITVMLAIAVCGGNSHSEKCPMPVKWHGQEENQLAAAAKAILLQDLYLTGDSKFKDAADLVSSNPSSTVQTLKKLYIGNNSGPCEKIAEIDKTYIAGLQFIPIPSNSDDAQDQVLRWIWARNTYLEHQFD
jgi:hypothetical protein